jgi:hypothetical protein
MARAEEARARADSLSAEVHRLSALLDAKNKEPPRVEYR